MKRSNIEQIDYRHLENQLMGNLISEVVKKEDDFLTQQLKYAWPPIKGDITKGKLKWRGIKLIEQRTNYSCSKWLEQRGIILGDKFTIEF